MNFWDWMTKQTWISTNNLLWKMEKWSENDAHFKYAFYVDSHTKQYKWNKLIGIQVLCVRACVCVRLKIRIEKNKTKQSETSIQTKTLRSTKSYWRRINALNETVLHIQFIYEYDVWELDKMCLSIKRFCQCRGTIAQFFPYTQMNSNN